MKRTILTIKEQSAYLAHFGGSRTLKHKWSCRGLGNSRILDGNDNLLGKAGGCGYDRYGTALGNAVSELFPAEVAKLAKRECKESKNCGRRGSKGYYGLFYNTKTKQAYIDGGCGSECVGKILNKIGFSLNHVGQDEKSNNGVVFYSIVPVTKNDRRFLT